MASAWNIALKLFSIGWIGVNIVTASPHYHRDQDVRGFASKDIITRDVCVIGGGSTGTYASIRLHDSGKSVVIVESKGRLGGHTETYIDPVSHIPVDIGVQVWHNLTIVKDYFARLGVDLAPADFGNPTNQYTDFRTATVVGGYTPPNPQAALGAYGAQIARYPYVEAGFNLPDPVPEDLLLPFGDFVKKYPAISDAVSLIFSFAQGLGDFLAQPTLYVFKNFGLDLLRNLQTGFLTTAKHDNSLLYESATKVLGAANILFNSKVLYMDRDAKAAYQSIIVQTPSGKKLIRAKKILMTIPPKLENLHGFDLDVVERNLFAQFQNSAYYTGLLRDTSLPPTISFTNTAANTPYNLPVLPGAYTLGPTAAPGLTSVFYGSPRALSEEQVKADIIATVHKLQKSNGVAQTEPTFAVFSSHTPFELTVKGEAIKAGFYRKLYALQGRRGMFYTGAAFHTHDSSLLWQFTEALLPAILKAL